MKKFFLPFAKFEAEDAFQNIKRFLASTGYGTGDRRIFRITFRHDGENQEAQVGEIFAPTNEPVIAILKGVTYFVCTPTRGVLRDMPILVGENEIRTVEDFEVSAEAPA